MVQFSSPIYWVILVWWFLVLKLLSLCWSLKLISLSLHFPLVKRGCWAKMLSSFIKEITMLNWGASSSELSCPRQLETSSPASNPLLKTLFNHGMDNWSTPFKKWRWYIHIHTVPPILLSHNTRNKTEWKTEHLCFLFLC